MEHMTDEHLNKMMAKLMFDDPLAWHRADRWVCNREGRPMVDDALDEIARTHGVGMVDELLANVVALIDGIAGDDQPGSRWLVARLDVAAAELREFLATAAETNARHVDDSIARLEGEFDEE